MKTKIAPATAGVIIVIVSAAVIVLGWKWAVAAGGVQSDVRPLVAVMNSGKPETEVVPPEIAHGDAFMMGSQKPKAKSSQANTKK